ncbi:MAG: tetratricopeptide repeat protein [Caulobacteraceae bacterium]
MAGQAGSPDAMRRLQDALAHLKAISVQPLLEKAVAALRAEDHQGAADWAMQALHKDERCGMAWYCLAIAREKAGDFKTSLQCYESALQLAPEHDEIASNLARLAYRMGLKDIAEKLLLNYLAKHPDAIEASNNLACIQRDQHRYGEAIATLTPVIQANQDNSLLWNTLGTVLTDQGDFESALPFFDEALRLDETFVKARYNRSTATLQMGDPDRALVDCEAALKGHMAEHERAMMNLARSTMLIARGELKDGWAAYDARLSHHYTDATLYMIDRPRWTPDADVRGKTLLLVGEQGLGDEGAVRQPGARGDRGSGPRGRAGAGGGEAAGPAVPARLSRRRGRGPRHLRHRRAHRAGDALRRRHGAHRPVGADRLPAGDLPPDGGVLPRPSGLSLRRPRARGPLEGRAGNPGARRPQGRHPVEEPEAGRRAAALLLAVRGLEGGAADPRRDLRRPAVRRHRSGEPPRPRALGREPVAPARHRPEGRVGRGWRP